MKQLFFFFILLTTLEASTQTYWSLNHKFGPTLPTTGKSELVNAAGLNILKNNFVYGVEFRKYFSAKPCDETPQQKRSQIGINLGRHLDKGKFRLSYQLGISLLSGIKKSDQIIRRDPGGWFQCAVTHYVPKEYQVPNFTARLGYKYMPTAHFGIGLCSALSLGTYDRY